MQTQSAVIFERCGYLNELASGVWLLHQGHFLKLLLSNELDVSEFK